MKIGTINIDWFKKSKATKGLIVKTIQEMNFDFLIVTENIESFSFDEKYFVYHSQPIPIENEFQYLHYGNYLKGETPIRTSIYSKCKSIQQIKVLDNYTSVCHQFEVNGKAIIIYGSIIGTWGIRYQNEIAKAELENFNTDLKNILATHENVVMAGDFNTSFLKEEKQEMQTIKSREALIQLTDSLQIKRITENIKENIDHIFLSKKLLIENEISIKTFLENDLKDGVHKGVEVKLKI